VRRVLLAALAALALLPVAVAAAGPAREPATAAAPRGWEPGVKAARAYAQSRQGTVAFAVRTAGRAASLRGDRSFQSASVVKAMLLVAYLRRPGVRGRALRANARAMLVPMVR